MGETLDYINQSIANGDCDSSGEIFTDHDQAFVDMQWCDDLDRLDRRSRSIVNLHREAGWTFARIGKQKNLSRQRVHELYRKALRRMRAFGWTVED